MGSSFTGYSLDCQETVLAAISSHNYTAHNLTLMEGVMIAMILLLLCLSVLLFYTLPDEQPLPRDD